jgi:hypothetical protein
VAGFAARGFLAGPFAAGAFGRDCVVVWLAVGFGAGLTAALAATPEDGGPGPARLVFAGGPFAGFVAGFAFAAERAGFLRAALRREIDLAMARPHAVMWLSGGRKHGPPRAAIQAIASCARSAAISE